MPSKVHLTGAKPFSSFTVPGVSPSAVVSRTPTMLGDDVVKALKKALKAGAIPNVTEADVEIVALARSGKAASTTDAALAEQVDALTVERDNLTTQIDALGDTLQEMRDENLALAEQVDALTAQAAESDGTTLASDILDSLTVPVLSDLAKTRKVEVDAKAAKADVIAALVSHAAASGTATE